MADESVIDPAALDRIRQAWVAADDAADRLIELGPGEHVFRAILDGRRRPSTYEWAAIAEALRVDVGWLVWGDDEAGLRKRLEIAEGAHGEMADLMEKQRKENLALRRQASAVRRLHQQYRDVFAVGDDDSCSHCNQIVGDRVPWPCPTIQALDGEAA